MKRLLVLGTVLVLAGLLAACGGGGTVTVTESSPPDTTTEEAPSTATEKPSAPELPAESTGAPPQPRTLKGSGARVLDLQLRRDGPLIVTGTHSGSSNFIIVHLIARGGSGTDEGLFNEIGVYKGQAVWADAASGRYRVQVDADGSWDLRFAQPVSVNTNKTVPGTLQGRGSAAVFVRSEADFQAVVTGRHQGQSNFIVHIVGFGDTQGDTSLFNEIGVFTGETVIDVPGGTFIVYVQADGSWALRFAE